MASKDDEKYMALMGLYKERRGELGPDALPYLMAAQKLAERGNVSEDVIKGMAYL